MTTTDAPLRVLLVEDNANDELLTLRSFTKHNLVNPVDVVRDGAEALEYLFCTGQYADRDPTTGPDVIFLDIKLPFVDGLEVLRQINLHPLPTRPLVVMLTTSDQDVDVQRCYELGANGYVVKPLDFASMSTTIGAMGAYWLAINHPRGQRVSTPPFPVHEDLLLP